MYMSPQLLIGIKVNQHRLVYVVQGGRIKSEWLLESILHLLNLSHNDPSITKGGKGGGQIYQGKADLF